MCVFCQDRLSVALSLGQDAEIHAWLSAWVGVCCKVRIAACVRNFAVYLSPNIVCANLCEVFPV